MIYTFQLRNTKTGETAEIEAPAHWPLEALSPKIKVAMRLPYNDYEGHWFHANGRLYMTDANVELSYECWGNRWPCGWRRGYSEHIQIRQMFTTLGFAVCYSQRDERIHCTLIGRRA